MLKRFIIINSGLIFLVILIKLFIIIQTSNLYLMSNLVTLMKLKRFELIVPYVY